MTGVRFSVLGVSLCAFRFDEATNVLLQAARDRVSTRVHFCTVSTLVYAREDPALRKLLNSAELVLPDGMPVVWLARLKGIKAERTCGPDITLALADRGRAQGSRHFLYGGKPAVTQELARRLRLQFPDIQIVGMHSPPFRTLTPSEDAADVEMINATEADFLWVGLGSPKQETWVAEHQARLSVPVLLAVGAAFDFHSQSSRRAPVFMQRAGLEWLFRLFLEPRRLWRRYTVTNAKFGWLLAVQLVRSLAHRGDARPG